MAVCIGGLCKYRGEPTTYKIPSPNMAMTDPFTRQSSCTFQSRKMGSVAKTQSVEMDTTTTAYERTVWMLRSLHLPGIFGSQFLLFSRSVFCFFLLYSSSTNDYLLYRRTLEKQVHACSAHDDQAQDHAGVNDPFEPLLAC